MAPIPTVRLFKDGASLIVNASDAAAWQADGWTTQAPEGWTDPALAQLEAKAQPVVQRIARSAELPTTRVWKDGTASHVCNVDDVERLEAEGFTSEPPKGWTQPDAAPAPLGRGSRRKRRGTSETGTPGEAGVALEPPPADAPPTDPPPVDDGGTAEAPPASTDPT